MASTHPHQITAGPDLQRKESKMSDNKGDVEEQEYPAARGGRTAAEDKDQVGYATFMAAQERGYEPVRRHVLACTPRPFAHQSQTAAESKRVLRRIDLFILPIFTFTQCLQFMDKSALNYANLFGYQQALGLHGSQCKQAMPGIPVVEGRG